MLINLCDSFFICKRNEFLMALKRFLVTSSLFKCRNNILQRLQFQVGLTQHSNKNISFFYGLKDEYLSRTDDLQSKQQKKQWLDRT